MARGVNKVILVGNLGQDPEIKYTANNTAVCNMRLATTETYKDQNGETQEKTEWHNLVAWARLAEICEQYLKKGSQIYVEGSIQYRQYEDKDGNTRYMTDIRVREMLMLGGRGDSSGGYSDGGGYSRGNQNKPQSAPADSDDAFDAEKDDLPF